MGMAVQCLSCARFLVGTQSIPFQRKPFLCSFLLSFRPRNLSSSIVAASSRKKTKKNLSQSRVTKGDDADEDAFELLFKQLEEDLKNDDMSNDDGSDDGSDDEITEEDMAMLERELQDALGDYDTELLDSDMSDTEGGDEPENGNDDDDGDERSLKLRNWQLKRLARALKAGRRKTSIKNLAADLCLDRALVLELLRNPPPNLLMMSLSLPDEPTAPVSSLEITPGETVLKEISKDRVESESKAQVPIHAMQRSWSAQKRLKKAHVDTLERVYRRSKRPTNS